MRNNLNLATIFTLLILLNGCGGGGNDSTSTNGSSTNLSNPSTGSSYDLAEYLFHDNLDIIGGSFEFESEYFDKVDGNRRFAFIEYKEKHVKADANSVKISDKDDSLLYTFVISDTELLETVHMDDNHQRTLIRQVAINDIYLDTTSDTSLDNSDTKVKCNVVAHFDSVDLNQLSGSFNIATGIYNDVLHLKCISGTGAIGQISNQLAITDYYFAKDIGQILSAASITAGAFTSNLYLIPRF